MGSTGNRETFKTLKTAFLVFCVWVLFNHSVRYLAVRINPKGDLLSYAGSMTFKSLDIFRRRTGDFIGRVKRYCPESVEEKCYQTVDSVRVGLGVN